MRHAWSAAGAMPIYAGALARLGLTLDAAIEYLRAHSDFDRFDRLAFISRHAVPTARALVKAQRALRIGWAAAAIGGELP